MIAVTVRLFAGVRERAGTAAVTVRLARGSNVAGALDAAAAAVPGEWRLPSKVMLALNGEYADGGATLADGDEVAVIPPVSGGAARPPHMISITSATLDAGPLNEFVTTDSDGAIVTFLGVTRNHNEGRQVSYLEYEAFQPMAEQQIAVIIAEMQSKWEIGRVAVAHRTGRVDIGQTSMVLAVGAPHRRPAFEAALYFVDRLKEVVPIWKKEHFQGGEVWIGETPGGGHAP
jgi:molybdopterin synthase catalytic subunit